MTAPMSAPHWSGVARAECVPRRAGQDAHTDALAGLDESHRVEDADGLAHDGPGHPVALVELVDAQHGARGELAGRDLSAEVVEHARMQGGATVRGHGPSLTHGGRHP